MKNTRRVKEKRNRRKTRLLTIMEAGINHFANLTEPAFGPFHANPLFPLLTTSSKMCSAKPSADIPSGLDLPFAQPVMMFCIDE